MLVVYRQIEEEFGRQGISRTSLFAAVAQLIKKDKEIVEVTTEDGLAYMLKEVIENTRPPKRKLA